MIRQPPSVSRRQLLFAGAALFAASEARAETPVYPDRSDLLRLKEIPDGPERRITTKADWEKRRAQILLNMQRVMGPLPGKEHRVPLDVRVEGEEETPSYLRRKLSFASAPGERVPAYLLLPKERRGRAPAALCLHQTVPIGKSEPVGLGGAPSLHYGKELAERGFVVLAPDYPSFADHKIDVYARGWQSGSMKAIWDNMRATDLLQSLPEVDGKRIACLGHSLGGHNTLFTAAFDRRIRALASSCGFTAFPRYYGGNLTGWTGPAYMPRIRTDFPTPEKMPFDFHEVVATLAPRAFLACAPLHDSNFDVQGVREVMSAAEPVYRLYGAADRLSALYPDAGHDWPQETREAAYGWIFQRLKAEG
ncbi:MAG: alpha/beta hydrolase family protein [Armatimonadota bacterium]